MERFGYDDASKAADLIRGRMRAHGMEPENIRDAVVLGSGLGSFGKEHLREDEAGKVSGPLTLSFGEIFEALNLESHAGQVEGHARKLVIGHLDGGSAEQLVFAQSGREHPYEGVSTKRATFWIRVMQVLRARTLLGSNAAGILTPQSITPPGMMLIADHRDYGADNVLTGPNDERFGPRFPHCGDLYAASLRSRFRAEAQKLGLKLTEGVYMRTPGPQYESRAHVYDMRAVLDAIQTQADFQPGETNYRESFAGVVGMSTTYEVLAAQHASQSAVNPAFEEGKAYVSVATNYSASLGKDGFSPPSNHAEVQEAADAVKREFGRLFAGVLASLQASRS